MSAGHVSIKRQIAKNGLARVAIFSGPQSVGKKAVVTEILQLIGVRPEDQFWSGKLTADQAKAAVQFAHTAPRHGIARALVLELDGAQPSALNRVLKTLEDPELPIWTIMLTRGVSEIPATLASCP